MPQSAACRRDSDALVSALLELELRRQRQQHRVQAALREEEEEKEDHSPLLVGPGHEP